MLNPQNIYKNKRKIWNN